MLHRLGIALPVAVLAACSARSTTPPSHSSPRAQALVATVAHRDPRTALPTFLWLRGGDRYPTAQLAAQATLRALQPDLRLEAAALAAVEQVAVHDAGDGPILVELAQRPGGVEVFRGRLKIALDRQQRPIAASGQLAPSLRGADRRRVLDDQAAVARALVAVGGKRAGLSRPARARPVLFPLPEGRLEPAYRIELRLESGDGRGLVVSALDGRILVDTSLVRDEAATYRVYADPDTKLPFDSPYGTAGVPHPTGAPSGFRPPYTASRLVTIDHYPFSREDPWLAPATLDTSGNNVDAYADVVQPDGFTPSSADRRAPMNGTRLFDHPYDTSRSPDATTQNVDASVTQLFYLMNFLHDWFYDAGFDEPSGNHQTDNFGRGGQGRDALRVEAQDYSGRNNANAYTPPDGDPPQIQMFIFSGTSTASLEVSAPASLVGVKAVGIAGFGKDAFDTAGTVVLGVDDTGQDPGDGCEPLVNDVAGKIVLVNRGLCSFVQKAQQAEGAGAIGIIVANVPSSAEPTIPPYMGGTGGNVGIPALSLALEDGQAMRAAVGLGVTVVMHRSLQTDLDGGLDVNIASHEWGHVLSGRLVGDGYGLLTNQAGGLGEGWADFVALLLTARPDDPRAPGGAGWSGVYPSGAYATAGGGTDYYFGIRRVPYSTDQTKNGLTLRHIANGEPLPAGVPVSFGEDGSFNAEVHNTGEVWATMLWECYVGLLREKKIPFAVAQEKMKRYLVAALKLTPVDPTLLEARDALLAAALATDEGAYKIFWRAFARRGAGVGAVGPGKTSSDNRGVEESFAAGNHLTLVEARLADDVVTCDHDGLLDEGERGRVRVKVRNDGSGRVEGATLVVSSATEGVLVDNGGFSTLPPLEPHEEASVEVSVRMYGAPEVEPLAVDVNLADPSFVAPRPIHVALPTRFHADESADAGTVDHVDTTGTSWTAEGFDGDTWARVHDGPEGWWKIVNSNLVSDHELRSAPFTIEGTTFSLSFRHRWSFRRSQRRMIDIDGGVVELSTDGGASWSDVGDFGPIDYNTTLDPNRASNVLRGRAAYGNTSSGWPDEWQQSRVDVGLPARPDSVMVRFRMGTAGGFTGAPGWEIDDIALEGISSRPFWSYVEHRDACDPAAPVADAGQGQRVRSGQVVVLAGAGSGGNGAALRYQWSQARGPFVVLVDRESANARFVAPEVDEDTEIVLQLRVDDGALLSAPAPISITVEPGRGCSAAPGAPGSSATLVFLVALLLGRGGPRRVRSRRGPA